MGQVVLAYHGCDISIRDQLVRGEIEPRISRNAYDWLGDGMYFFEGDHQRALKLAVAAQTRPEHLLSKQPIATPAVVGAVLDVDRWFDLTTQIGILNFTTASAAVTLAHEHAGKEIPVNKAAFPGDEDLLHRAFDKAVCDMVVEYRKLFFEQALSDGNAEGIIASAPYQAARGAFEQGKLIAEGSSIHTDTHIQIAVRDLSCIKGWFLVPGDRLLTDEDLAVAISDLASAKAARSDAKPREKASSR